MIFDIEDMYRITSRQDRTALIGINVEEVTGNISWFDMNHQRMIDRAKISQEGEAIIAKGEDGRVYKFIPLTLNEYNKNVKSKIDGEPEFRTREEMIEFFRAVPGRMYTW